MVGQAPGVPSSLVGGLQVASSMAPPCFSCLWVYDGDAWALRVSHPHYSTDSHGRRGFLLESG